MKDHGWMIDVQLPGLLPQLRRFAFSIIEDVPVLTDRICLWEPIAKRTGRNKQLGHSRHMVVNSFSGRGASRLSGRCRRDDCNQEHEESADAWQWKSPILMC